MFVLPDLSIAFPQIGESIGLPETFLKRIAAKIEGLLNAYKVNGSNPIIAGLPKVEGAITFRKNQYVFLDGRKIRQFKWFTRFCKLPFRSSF